MGNLFKETSASNSYNLFYRGKTMGFEGLKEARGDDCVKMRRDDCAEESEV